MFLSVVSNRSNPAASAAAISSPLTSRSHPRSIASTTMWPSRAYRSGAGLPLSKSMGIDHLDRWDRRSVQAPRREFDHRDNLFTRQMEPIHNLADRGSHFQVVKDDGNRRPRVPEHPCSAAFPGNAFDSGTLGPI